MGKLTPEYIRVSFIAIQAGELLEATAGSNQPDYIDDLGNRLL